MSNRPPVADDADSIISAASSINGNAQRVSRSGKHARAAEKLFRAVQEEKNHRRRKIQSWHLRFFSQYRGHFPMKKRRGCLIACMAAAIAALLFTGAFVFAVAGGFVDYRLETYDRWHGEQTEWAEQREGRSNPMPSLNELKTAQKVQFQQYTGNFWGNEAYTLIAKYQRDQYEDVKRSLEETLMFETEVIDQGKKDSRIEPEFVMERFDVRLLKTGGLPYAVEVPKHMYFFGTSNDSCEILYIYYHDVDLDSVSGTLEESVPEYIHWPSMKWLERMPILQNFCLPVI